MTVAREGQTYGRGGSHYHFLLAIGSRLAPAEVDAFLWWFPRWQEGDTVQAEVWNGRVTCLADANASFITRQSPLNRRQDFERAAGYVALGAWLPAGLKLLDGLRRRLWRS